MNNFNPVSYTPSSSEKNPNVANDELIQEEEINDEIKAAVRKKDLLRKQVEKHSGQIHEVKVDTNTPPDPATDPNSPEYTGNLTDPGWDGFKPLE